MKDLYSRLKDLGFDGPFVRAAFLPDWWDDRLAEVPANRALAEVAVARNTGLPVAALRDPDADLKLAPVNSARFKTRATTELAELVLATRLAQRAASLVAGALGDSRSEYRGPWPADRVRAVLLENRTFVGLKDLVDFCWANGIVVLHLESFPTNCKRFDGMAMFCGEIPVIALASRRDGHAWLAFHLAHELGHLLAGHVAPGQGSLTDEDLGSIGDDAQEREANRLACHVLTGVEQPWLGVPKTLTGQMLADWARDFGNRHRVDPGLLALIHGRAVDRWGAAQKALEFLGQSTGAKVLIRDALRSQLGEVPWAESAERFLAHIGAI